MSVISGKGGLIVVSITVCLILSLLTIPTIIYSLRIAARNEIANEWVKGIAILAGENTTIVKHYGSFANTVEVFTTAKLENDEEIVSVVIIYPQPPQALRLREAKEADAWLASLHNGQQIFIDIDSDKVPHTAVSEMPPYAWDIVSLILSMAIIIGGVIIFVLAFVICCYY